MKRKIALVTGAGRRLGQELAVHTAKLGYDLCVHYNSSAAGAEETKRQAEALGAHVTLIKQDLTALEAPRRIIEKVRVEHGSLDLLINSASTFPANDRLTAPNTFENETEEEWETALAVNARAPFFLIKYAAPIFQPDGIIVNILDQSAIEPSRSRASHSVSKAALRSITALTAKSFPIRVNELLLGNILPGENMSSDLASQVEWLGVPPVLEALERILRGEIENGAMVSVTQKKKR